MKSIFIIERQWKRSLIAQSNSTEGIQQRLLPGDTPQLGAASLQEIVKRLSEKNGIGIRSFRILEPKEIDSFRKVSLQIDFNPTNSMLSLGQFMHDIEHHEKELMISEMDLLVLNIRMPNNIQGSMVISGLMKGTKTQREREEGIMSLRYGVLSLLVLFAIFILALKNYETWTLPIEVLPEKGATKKSGTKIESPPAEVGQKEPTDIESYIFVAEKNIFSSERKEFPIIAPPPALRQDETAHCASPDYFVRGDDGR